MALVDSIEPLQIALPAVQLEIQSVSIQFNSFVNYATVICAYKDADGNTQKITSVELDASDLSSWGEDDQVLLGIVKTKLGIVS